MPTFARSHHDQHLADELGVERRGDLVEEHDVRIHHQSPGDRHSLLLPARELVREPVRLLLEPDALEKAAGARLGLRTPLLADATRGEREVVDHAQVRKQVELLKDDSDALPNGRNVDALARDLVSLEEDSSRIDRLEQVDAAQKRALAAAARADDDEDFARSHLQVDAVENEEVAEALANVL